MSHPVVERPVVAAEPEIPERKPAAAEGPRPWHDTPLVRRARTVLTTAGDATPPAELLELAVSLRDQERRFGYARRLLAVARQRHPHDDDALARRLRQQHARCTYQDPDLPMDSRLDRALGILADGEELATTRDQETLGLAGSIHRRKWEVDGRREHLERSLSYYLRGAAEGVADQGYTAINAAYDLDLLAAVEDAEAQAAGVQSESAARRQERAAEIRRELVGALASPRDRTDGPAPGPWWYHATLGEAYFGLRRYEDARAAFEEGKRRSGPAGETEWALQSTATQLASIARLQHPGLEPAEFEATDAARVIAALVGESTAVALSAYVGKVGLALSGGGFRASFFHVGVLARLAELDVLRRVEVLSCVSGGSIVGAQYYLELRRLLSTRRDAEITREDYVACVRKVQRDFLAGVKANIRTRILAELTTNLKMVFLPGYSRTMRAGELFERFLFDRVEPLPADAAARSEGAGGRSRPWHRYRRWLTDLYIVPPDGGPGFRPKSDNWRRQAKVPELVLNATTLNTGHNWQFTASWMGEPPAGIDEAIDGNIRLRRLYYWQAPEAHRRVRLGYAVAASACVPGLFEPLQLRGLYQDHTVRLVDGGVHDNQGVTALLDQDCNVLLVSDASGQMGTEAEPGSGALGVLLRSNSILMARVRGEQYDDLAGRLRGHLLRGLMFLHLRSGLPVDPVRWVDSTEPPEEAGLPGGRHAAGSDAGAGVTPYGVPARIQERIAAIRTDLDSFSDAEAFALMTSGYRMADRAFSEGGSLSDLEGSATGREAWDFLRVEDAMHREPRAGRLARLLEVGSRRAFKVWQLSTPLKVVAALVLLAAVAVLGWVVVRRPDAPLLTVTVGGLAITALVLVAGPLLGRWAVRLLHPRQTLLRIGLAVLLSLGGVIVVRLHLWLFDRLFLRLGSIDRFTRD